MGAVNVVLHRRIIPDRHQKFVGEIRQQPLNHRLPLAFGWHNIDQFTGEREFGFLNIELVADRLPAGQKPRINIAVIGGDNLQLLLQRGHLIGGLVQTHERLRQVPIQPLHIRRVLRNAHLRRINQVVKLRHRRGHHPTVRLDAFLQVRIRLAALRQLLLMVAHQHLQVLHPAPIGTIHCLVGLGKLLQRIPVFFRRLRVGDLSLLQRDLRSNLRVLQLRNLQLIRHRRQRPLQRCGGGNLRLRRKHLLVQLLQGTQRLNLRLHILHPLVCGLQVGELLHRGPRIRERVRLHQHELPEQMIQVIQRFRRLGALQQQLGLHAGNPQ